MSETGALTGGTAELWLPSGQVLFATDVDFSEAHALFRMDVLGDPYSKEILVDGVTCAMSAGAVWSFEQDWYQFNVAVSGTGIAVVTAPAVTAVLRNNVNNQVVRSMTGLKMEGHRLTTRRGMAVMTNVSMQGIAQIQGNAGDSV